MQILIQFAVTFTPSDRSDFGVLGGYQRVFVIYSQFPQSAGGKENNKLQSTPMETGSYQGKNSMRKKTNIIGR